MKALTWLLVLGLVTSSATQFNITVDDSHTSIAYTTFPAWNTDVWPRQDLQPFSGTNHGTQSPGASATLQFAGTAIYVYGQKGRDYGFHNISVDSATTVLCSGRTGQLGPRSLLFSTQGLSQGPHTITITHVGIAGERLDIDYFLITSGGEAAILIPRASHSKRATRHIAVIAGGAGGGIVVILLFLMLVFYYIGRHKRRLSGFEAPSVLIKRSRKPEISHPQPTHYPGPSTKPISDPHTSYHYLRNSNPSATQEFNPYHSTAQMLVHYSEPRSTLGSASMYSNQTFQVAQSVPDRRSPESRPLSSLSQPLSTASHPLSTSSQPLSSTSSQSLSTTFPPRSTSHQQAAPPQQRGPYRDSPFQQGSPYQPGAFPQQSYPYPPGASSQQREPYQQARVNYAGVGAGSGPLVMSYDVHAGQSRFTHLPEKRRPEEMDPVYQSSSDLVGGSAPIPAPVRVQKTYRAPGTEQDRMSPPPEYHKERR